MVRSWFFLLLFTSSALALPGDLDPAFGTGGKVLTNIRGTYDIAATVAILEDGKILVGGGEGFVLARYLPNGSLDASFGSTGRVVSSESSGSLIAMKLQPDGTIVTAGVAGFPGDVRVTRYSASGTQLSSATLDFGNDDLAVALDFTSDGRIVVAGYSGVNDPGNIIVARFTATGSPDATFGPVGSGGKVITDISGFEDSGAAVAVLENGKILVAGTTRNASSNPRDVVLVRYEANGALDQTFGVGGKWITPLSAADDAATAMALQPDGKILVGGQSSAGNHYHVTLARFHPDGTPDNSFGEGGKVVTQTGSFRSSVVSNLVLQVDGKIVVAAVLDEFQEDFLVLRYHANGTLDQTFGSGGRVQTLFGGSVERPAGVALQRDGKIVVAGYSYQNQTGYDFAIVRYLGDGPTGGTFNITPPSPAPANSPLTATFGNWSAATLPLSYELRAGANVLVPAGANPAPQFQLAAGTYQLKGRIYDGAGNFSETATISFQTAEGPVASTQHASEVMTYSARLHGTVNANSLSTQVSWLYGTDLPLTMETPAQTLTGAKPAPMSQAITGLQPGTRYFFRTRAVNSIGESFGDVVNFTTASADPVHTILHATRQAVPFAGSAGVPEGAVWAAFGEPSLLGTGNSLGFSATIRAETRAVQGVFSGPLDAPSLKLKAGDPATGPDGVSIGGAAFARFKSPVFANADCWAILATVTGSAVTSRNDTGIWAGEPGGVTREVAREGSVAPGTFGAIFKSFTAVMRPDAACVAFTAKLQGPGVSPENDEGLWTWSPSGGTVLHIREGANNLAALPGLPVKRLQVLEWVPGAQGHGFHDNQFFGGLATAANGEQAIVNFARTGVQSYARSSAPLSGEIVVRRFGQPCWLPGTNSYTARATLSLNGASSTPINAPAILRDGVVTAQKGELLPGVDRVFYRGFGNPVADYARGGEPCTAFTALISGRGITSRNDQAVFATLGSTGTPELIAQEGAAPPGTPDALWSRFRSVSVLSGRGALFTATYVPRDPAKPPGSGLWVEDSSGVLQLLLRTGSVIEGKKVRSLTVLSQVIGSPTQRRSWVQGPRTLRPASVLSRVTFTDGTSALVTTAVP